MAAEKTRGDKRFPTFVNDNLFRRLFLPPRRLIKPYVREGQTVADLGCGPGFFTLALADCVGPKGKVYAVDVDARAIRKLEQKTDKRGLRNIEARAVSASDLSFVTDGSVDFILSHGLLCSMAPKERPAALAEMKRVLNPDGLAFISVATGPWSYVDRAEWGKILEGFEVRWKKRSSRFFEHRAAVVSLKKR
jgi:ubiquinone/menaquinone biosynthesis C-methylase UbiE